MLSNKKSYTKLLLFTVALIIGLFLFSCFSNHENKNRRTIASILDSASLYLDSVPQIVKYAIDSVRSSVDCHKTVIFCTDDFAELQKHIEASLHKRFDEEQKKENIILMLQYVFESKLEQLNHCALSKKELKKLFETLHKPDLWSNGEIIVESEWFDSDTMIVLIGQSHSFNFTDSENRAIVKIQSDIYKTSEVLIEQGIDLFMLEGFTQKEIDRRIATKSHVFRMFANVEKYYEYHIDSLYPVYTFGYEDLKVYTKADSIFKLMFFTENYLKMENCKLPLDTCSFKQSFTSSVRYLVDSLRDFSYNLDTTRLYDSVFNYIAPFDVVEKTNIESLWAKLAIEANKLILNKRNEMALNFSSKTMKRINRNVAILKIGNNHLHRRTLGNIESKFENHLITIQDLCKKRKISYIYLLTEDDAKKLY